tara:strand:+ start:30289 stop:30639 length:351 start_codon:yes stop_codon:yes gene_type:complete
MTDLEAGDVVLDFRDESLPPPERQTGIGTSKLVAWLGLAAVIGLLATSYVYLRNLHVQKGNEIRDWEEKISQLDAEIELYEVRIARLMTRESLEAGLDPNSGLIPIDPAKVLVIGK